MLLRASCFPYRRILCVPKVTAYVMPRKLFRTESPPHPRPGVASKERGMVVPTWTLFITPGQQRIFI